LSRFTPPLGSNDHDEQICNLIGYNWWSQNNQHFQLLENIHEYGKSPPRTPGLFGREHLILINSSL
jgi:hypothetical protein